MQKRAACFAHGQALLRDTPLAIVDSNERAFRGSTLPEYYCAELDMSERTGWGGRGPAQVAPRRNGERRSRTALTGAMIRAPKVKDKLV